MERPAPCIERLIRKAPVPIEINSYSSIYIMASRTMSRCTPRLRGDMRRREEKGQRQIFGGGLPV